MKTNKVESIKQIIKSEISFDDCKCSCMKRFYEDEIDFHELCFPLQDDIVNNIFRKVNETCPDEKE